MFQGGANGVLSSGERLASQSASWRRKSLKFSCRPAAEPAAHEKVHSSLTESPKNHSKLSQKRKISVKNRSARKARPFASRVGVRLQPNLTYMYRTKAKIFVPGLLVVFPRDMIWQGAYLIVITITVSFLFTCLLLSNSLQSFFLNHYSAHE